VPLSWSRETRPDNNEFEPDPCIKVEHEWGHDFFGIAAGIAVMYMHEFHRETLHYGTITYRAAPIYNFVLGVRGGLPSKGFRGRISWPIPFLMNFDGPNNIFFEYSAIGIFGSDKIKGGFGIQGILKYREGEYIDAVDSDPYYDYYDDYDDEYEEARERYVMIPCGKIAFKVGNHIVISFSIDIGGMIFPSFDDDPFLWTPTIGGGIVYSFAPVRGPDALDGRF
jgi:hypothetical protein